MKKLQEFKMELNEQIESIRNSQKTIDSLLKDGVLAIKNGKTEAKWTLETIYNEPDCTIGFASTESGFLDIFPNHCHPFSIEYLIVATGKILLSLEGVSRIMNPGDCASIPKGATHSTRPMVENTKVIYVCVPFDEQFGKGKVK